jgi:hypothetical protein
MDNAAQFVSPFYLDNKPGIPIQQNPIQYMVGITHMAFLNRIECGIESNAPWASSEHTYTGDPLLTQ